MMKLPTRSVRDDWHPASTNAASKMRLFTFTVKF
jgi:hypothetical protein